MRELLQQVNQTHSGLVHIVTVESFLSQFIMGTSILRRDGRTTLPDKSSLSSLNVGQARLAGSLLSWQGMSDHLSGGQRAAAFWPGLQTALQMLRRSRANTLLVAKLELSQPA